MLKSKFFVFLCLITLNVGLWADSAHSAHWDYSNEKGPKHWGDLDKGFALCKIGKQQTPINIISSKTQAGTYGLKLNYTKNTQDIVNNGHTIQVNVAPSASTLTFNDTAYELVQFHFHTPSENQIDSVSYPLEVHFVHKNAAGNLLVVAVLFEEGQENKVLKKIVENLPQSINKPNKFQKFNMNDLLPANKSYYEFIGSLTTPPCSENVQWVVMKNQLNISKKQLESFQAVLHENARNIQPLNKRIVKSVDE